MGSSCCLPWGVCITRPRHAVCSCVSWPGGHCASTTAASIVDSSTYPLTNSYGCSILLRSFPCPNRRMEGVDAMGFYHGKQRSDDGNRWKCRLSNDVSRVWIPSLTLRTRHPAFSTTTIASFTPTMRFVSLSRPTCGMCGGLQLHWETTKMDDCLTLSFVNLQDDWLW
jgi:hypothetical protein